GSGPGKCWKPSATRTRRKSTGIYRCEFISEQATARQKLWGARLLPQYPLSLRERILLLPLQQRINIPPLNLVPCLHQAERAKGFQFNISIRIRTGVDGGVSPFIRVFATDS